MYIIYYIHIHLSTNLPIYRSIYLYVETPVPSEEFLEARMIPKRPGCQGSAVPDAFPDVSSQNPWPFEPLRLFLVVQKDVDPTKGRL